MVSTVDHRDVEVAEGDEGVDGVEVAVVPAQVVGAGVVIEPAEVDRRGSPPVEEGDEDCLKGCQGETAGEERDLVGVLVDEEGAESGVG